MPLSKAQKEMLDKYQIPENLQQDISNMLGDDGSPKNSTHLDFLQILSDKLQAAEELLYAKRQELAFEQDKIKGYIDKPRQLVNLEDTIKEYWTTAAALWQAADQVVNRPEAGFKVTVSQKHAEYAIQHKNLPVLELIRWAKPELFTLTPSFILQCIAWGIGGLGGAVLGLFGGFLGGIRYGITRFSGIRRLAAVWYAIVGIFMGWAVGGVMGARMGFQTGRPLLACSFGATAAFLNPLNEPRGTLNRHAIELKMEEIVFNLAQKNVNNA